MKYSHIPQKPYCCVPACVQMILQRRDLPILSQDIIAYEFGVILPMKDKHLLSKSYTGRKPRSGWGTRIDIKKYSLTEFFKKHKFPLKEKFYSAEDFLTGENFKEFLLKEIKMKSDLLICFNYPLLYHIEGGLGACFTHRKCKRRQCAIKRS